ncbi:MAG TPA: Maf family protein [Armatimonadota bacterium]|nr:Maf family protein [Armatimonadota bacterium]HOM71274.1 Maf family protein [Armatimonadota bacterium]HOP81101.1 Maf family protein [Armatimonadota bacterium]HPP75590.1 Maf family protein [Armatimonadota bacterium]
MKTRIILASASPRRRELLALINPDFKVVPSAFDESLIPEDLSPREHVMMSAAEKAKDVASGIRKGIVIGSDTVVAVDEHILGKPENEEDAKRMLKMLSGRTHQVYTGVHVIKVENGNIQEKADFECTNVHFCELSDETIERYVKTGEPLDKAGAYAIQGKASVLIKGITGCYFNVVGLPIYKLSCLLKEFGVEVMSCR